MILLAYLQIVYDSFISYIHTYDLINLKPSHVSL
jgi:hypothetical protein